MKRLLIACLMVFLPVTLALTPASAQSDDSFRASVFFPFGETDVPDIAALSLKGVVREAAGRPYRRVLIEANTDRATAAGEAVTLTRKMGESVKAWLVAHGIDGAKIVIVANGSNQPKVPTDDGIREAQNRRVDITVNWQ